MDLKFAAIDVGSNSVHMVIVEAAAGGFRTLARDKEMVRLGDALARGVLTDAAMERAMAVLARFRDQARAHGAEAIVAVATSAVREAANGEAFADRVERALGFRPRVVSGETEARLIHRAATHDLDDDAPVLVVDVGGGSVELAAGRPGAPVFAVSVPAGVLRLSARDAHDPLPPDAEAALEARVRAAFASAVSAARRVPFTRVLGCSGTVACVATLAAEVETGRPPSRLHHLRVGATAVAAVRRRLARSTHAERRAMRAVGERRADIAVAGAVLVDTLMQMLGAPELLTSEHALREGVVLEQIAALRRAADAPVMVGR